MSLALTLLSAALWWVLYSSMFALLSALIASTVLRAIEHSGVVFNRVYLACLLWNLVGLLLIAAVALHEGHARPPYAALLASTPLRAVLVINMLIGALLLWRLIPRLDARRIRLASACAAVAVVTAIGFGAAASLV